MLCNIKPVPFHESDKHIFAKIPGGVRTPGPPSGSAHEPIPHSGDSTLGHTKDISNMSLG